MDFLRENSFKDEIFVNLAARCIEFHVLTSHVVGIRIEINTGFARKEFLGSRDDGLYNPRDKHETHREKISTAKIVSVRGA